MKKSLATVDWILLGLTVSISVFIGLFFAFFRGGQRTTQSFLHGGRKMPLIPTILSLVVSFQSGIMILGESSEMYMKGITYFWYTLGIVIALPVTAVIFVPIFYRLQMTSVFEYLEVRFESKVVRYFANILWMLQFVTYMGVVLYAPATAMSAVSHIHLETLLVVTTAACIFYTMIGGLKAVVWTDAFQAFIMYAGLLSILIQGLMKVGGVSAAYKIARDHGRLTTEQFRTTANPFVYLNVWIILFGETLGWTTSYSTNQASVQRYCSLPTLRKAKWSILMLGPLLLTMVPLSMLCGFVMFAYYAECDPIESGTIENRDQLIPYFVLDAFDDIPGLAGLFMATLYSGTLSTVSTGINSVAAVIWEDYIKAFSRRRYTEYHATLINKVLVFIVGLSALAVSFCAKYLGGVLQAVLTVITSLGTPVSGVFLLALLFPWANKLGALAGMSSSLIILCWLCIGGQVYKPYRESLPRSISGCNLTLLTTVEPVTDPTLTGANYIYSLSYKTYGPLGYFLVLAVGIVVSVITISDWNIPVEKRRFYWSGWYTMLRRFVSERKLRNIKPQIDVVEEPIRNVSDANQTRF